MPGLSINKIALPLVREMMDRSGELGLKTSRTSAGATVIDAGIEARGGYLAGKMVTEVCLGGLGSASLKSFLYGDFQLPSIFVTTDHPTISLLGSQYAGWKISVGKFFAMGSGPARALSLKPKELYSKIEYRDESDTAIIVLETTEKPTDEVVEYVSKECGVGVEGLYMITVPTSSLAGSTQISGRIVETGLNKLVEVGFDPKRVLYGSGYAPIAPVHPKFARAMGRTNDVLLYGGVTFFTVDYDDDESLRGIVEKVPSSKSKDYGKPFFEIFKEAGYDFYKIDPALFAPAAITVNNIKTGSIFKAGQINIDVLKRSISL